MEVNAPGQLVTPAGTILLNSSSNNYLYWLTGLPGFDGPEPRVTVDDKSREDGAVVHSSYDGALHGMVEGIITSPDPATRNAAEEALKAAVKSIRRSDGTLTFTPTGLSARSLTVRRDTAFVSAILQGTLHTFQFGLVSGGDWV